jgi:hypothetical protein
MARMNFDGLLKVVESSATELGDNFRFRGHADQ